ncbi:DUF411 domain-containing protein [uncultured Ramlibacter sp.]|uniref:DUF411 domain-containing protein n=1 Tax=uncultured Ramlibacter sp. TaxID=260755 RepID=UPI002618D514|nr:DUF411 domain-containing protein [uncultured Ramlibacter sp.]
MNRRNLLSLAAVAAAIASLPSLAAAPLPQVEVYKNSECGCCGAWVEHMKAAGFPVKVHETPDTSAIRKRYGIPDSFGSCHTGVVAGYALEGHVPAEEVKRLLAKKPAAAGLSVPGMPVGSPGMEMGSRKDPFQVLLIDKAGRSSVFASYPKT